MSAEPQMRTYLLGNNFEIMKDSQWTSKGQYL
jgi:hypothetical protein